MEQIKTKKPGYYYTATQKKCMAKKIECPLCKKVFARSGKYQHQQSLMHKTLVLVESIKNGDLSNNQIINILKNTYL